MKRNLFNFIVVVVLLIVVAVACNREKPVTGITLDQSTIELVETETTLLTATVTPSDATNRLVNWTSSNPEVVTVVRGSLTAMAIGTATITVTTNDGGFTAKCIVTVAPLPDPIEPDMIRVEGGTFIMGCTDNECENNEKPTLTVKLDSYYIARYPVTQREWVAIMRNNPSHFKGEYLPVENMSWDEVTDFLHGLNLAFPNKNYRLATEAEWEYAARGGNESKGYKYSGSDDINAVAWYSANSNNRTQIVGTKMPNELGIFDMSGNVWEWCSDFFGSYADTARTGYDSITGIYINPTGPRVGIQHVARGGAWIDFSQSCRISARYSPIPPIMPNHLGIRLAMSVE